MIKRADGGSMNGLSNGSQDATGKRIGLIKGEEPAKVKIAKAKSQEHPIYAHPGPSGQANFHPRSK